MRESERIRVLQARALELEARVEELSARAAAVLQRRYYPEDLYVGPFYLSRSANLETVQVGQGYVFAGDLAEYDWPQAGDTDTVDVSGLADDNYLLVMTVVVDGTYGVFSTGNLPTLSAIAASSHHLLNGVSDVDVIIGEAVVEDGKAIGIKQRCFRDIYLPVRKWEDTAPGYNCRLTNVDDAAESADPNASGVEKCHAGE